MHDPVEMRADSAGSETGAPTRAQRNGPNQISRELERAICAGTFSYGDRLPAERDLAEQYQTSRSTVRQALQRLESENIVSRRKGSGTFVTYVPRSEDAHLAEITSPMQLVDVRFALEPHIVRMAIFNASPRDLDRVKRILDQFDPSTPQRDLFATTDEAFHQALADATGNPLFMQLYRRVNRVRSDEQWNAMKLQILTPERMRTYHAEHLQIYDALKKRDKTAAETAMREHLDRIRWELVGAEAA